MRLDDGKAEADLITVELIPNDGKADLGTVFDESDDTFCGNLNQILKYLLENTRATVIILIANRSRYNHVDPEDKFAPGSEYMIKRLEFERAVEYICGVHGIPCFNAAKEANIGYYRVSGNNDYIRDQIHDTEEGGRILAQYYWGKLKNLYPLK